MGSNRFVICVGSNGCTDKGSFKVDVKKEEGLSSHAPHYVLTIRRIKADECKSIVAEGTMVLFDLGKDLGITGDFTYSLTNRVFASSRVQPSGESLMSVIEKYFTSGFSEIKEIKPEPNKTAEAESPSESLRLYLDSGKGDPNVVRRFIEQGADVNTRDENLITPLHNAIHYKHAEAAKVLISHGADVNARNVEENTPLYVAVHQEQEEVARFLLEKGAEVNAGNKYGYTPLRESCRWGNPAIVELLIAKGADVNVKDKKGDSPIHIAVDEGHADAVKVLLDHGADVNAIGTFGDAPIHSAVARGYAEIVKLLVSNGADLTLKDRRGNSPMDIAVADDNQEIIDLLKKCKKRKKEANLLQAKSFSAEGGNSAIPKNKFDLALSRPLALAYLIENKQFYLNQPLLISGVRPEKDKPNKAMAILGQKKTDQDWVLEDGASAIWVSGISAPGYDDPFILAARFGESGGVLHVQASLRMKAGQPKKTNLRKGEYVFYPLPGSKSNTCPVKLLGDSVEIVYYDPFESVILQAAKPGLTKLRVFSQWWNSSEVEFLAEYELVVE